MHMFMFFKKTWFFCVSIFLKKAPISKIINQKHKQHYIIHIRNYMLIFGHQNNEINRYHCEENWEKKKGEKWD